MQEIIVFISFKILLPILLILAVSFRSEAQSYIVAQLGNGDTIHLQIVDGGKLWKFDSAALNKKLWDSMDIKMCTRNLPSIPTNTNQLTNGAGYLVSSDISGKKNIIDSTGNGGYATLYQRNKARDSVAGLLTGYVATSRTISTTSPLTGGGDLSANRAFAIGNSAADNATKGAASFDSSNFSASSGNISWVVKYGTGSVSANAVTINAPRGKITYTSPSISAGTATGVTFTNSYINSTSIINIGLNGNGSSLTGVNCYMKSQTSGSCVINIQNLSLLSLFNSSLVIDYFIVN